MSSLAGASTLTALVRRASVFAAFFSLLGAGASRAAEPTAAPALPKYQSLRYMEDWSVLRDPGVGQGDPLDPLKYIDLGADGRFWVSLGGQLRERVEVWDAFNFGDTGGDDDDDVFLLSRVRAHADLHAGEMFRVFVEMKSALATERDLPGGTRTLDVDDIDLQNGFIDLRVPLGDSKDSFTLRGGRQELLFGGERLVSPLDWTNTRRTFDGGSGIWNAFGWTLHSFYTEVVEIQKHNFNEPDEDTQFWGAYLTGPEPLGSGGPKGLDVYWLAIEREQITFNATSGEEDRHTFGARVWGPLGGDVFDYELEAAYQFGDLSGADINAGMFTGEVGVNLPEAPGALRLVGGVDYASGDENAGDGDVETFNQLFPLGHKFLGYVDIVGRQNILDLRGSATMVPLGTLRVTLDTHYFRRSSDDDALYNAQGGVARADLGSDAEDVGVEMDLTLRQPVGRHVDVLFGYSHFFAGEFIEETGPDRDIDFTYLQSQYTF